MRAEDVVRTYQTVMADECGSLYQKNFLERFTKVEALDASACGFTSSKPLAMFMNDIEFGVISFHGAPPGACRPPRVIGAGPYMLKRADAAQRQLDANPYYPASPKLPHVEIKVVRDAAARILMLVGGSARSHAERACAPISSTT